LGDYLDIGAANPWVNSTLTGTATNAHGPVDITLQQEDVASVKHSPHMTALHRTLSSRDALVQASFPVASGAESAAAAQASEEVVAAHQAAQKAATLHLMFSARMLYVCNGRGDFAVFNSMRFDESGRLVR